MLRKLFLLTSLLVPLCLVQPLFVTAVAAESTEQQAAAVNLNTASAAEMANALVGVGVKRAEAIIKLREQIGGFSAIEQLLEVKGIGPKLLEKNAGRMVF